jgi:hypothetical protein
LTGLDFSQSCVGQMYSACLDFLKHWSMLLHTGKLSPGFECVDKGYRTKNDPPVHVFRRFGRCLGPCGKVKDPVAGKHRVDSRGILIGSFSCRANER